MRNEPHKPPQRRLLGILAAAALTFGPALEDSTPAVQGPDLSALRIPHKKLVLSNGLTLLVHEDHNVPVVAVNLWYHVGSRNERRGRTGFAHLFEHFFFNGSENYPHGFREAMDDLGASNRNGTTNTDRTNFFEDVPVSALERTLFLEADRMGFLAGNLSQEMLERERGVVSNEKRQGENRPYGRVSARILEAMYPASHPYSWSTIGLMEDLQAASLDDVRDWYRTYYGPNNCVLSLAGDISFDRARALVEKYFGSIPPGPPLPRLKTWVPRLESDLRDSMQDRVPQPRVYRVYHAPPWGAADLVDLQLAAGVLAGSRSSRLERRLVYEKDLATAVTAGAIEREIAGGFNVTVAVKADVDPAAAEKEMDAVLAEFLDKGPTAEELQRAHTRIMADLLRGIERLGGFGGRSDLLAESMTYGGDPDAYLEQLRMMQQATPARVRESARRWLGAHHYTLVVSPFPDLKAGDVALDRKTLPPLAEPPDVRFPRIVDRELSNGARLMLLRRPGAGLVNVTLAVDAGYAADPQAAPGTASMALGLMQEGTLTRDAFKLSDDLDAVGAQITTQSSLDLSFVRLRAIKPNLAGSLELFADVALHPAFSEAMLQIGKRRQLARIGQEKAQPVASAMRLAGRILYGEGHPYAAPLTGSGTEASVQRMKREDLVAWHEAWFRPSSATLIVVGDVGEEDVVPQLERVFGAWKRGKAPAKSIGDVLPGKGGRVFLIDKPDAPQSLILAAHVSERGGQGDDLAKEAVMRLFGGMATSRLNRNLRLEKHWSYGVNGSLLDSRGPRPFAVIAPVQTDKTKESMLELRKEILGIAGQRPIQGEEYTSLMRNIVSALPSRFGTLAALEAAAEDMVSYGYPAEYFYEYASRMRRLSEADLAATAARFIKPERVVWLVVGDLKKIEAGIRELGFGEVVKLDSDGRPSGV